MLEQLAYALEISMHDSGLSCTNIEVDLNLNVIISQLLKTRFEYLQH